MAWTIRRSRGSAPRIGRLSGDIGRSPAIVSASSAGEITAATDALTEMLGYFTELVERRRVERRRGL